MSATTIRSDMIPPRDQQELDRRVKELREAGMDRAAEALIDAYHYWYRRR